MLLKKRIQFKALVFMVLLLSASTISRAQQLSEVDIVFTGNQVFSSQQLLEQTNTLLKRYAKSNGEFNPEILDYCMRAVTNFIRAEGYLRGEAGEPKLEEIAGRLRITVPIKEGTLYRVGEIKYEGATLFTPEQLREMTPLKTGDVANGDAIGKLLFEDMQKLYADRGYIEYVAEPEPLYRLVPVGSNEGVVDFKVTINEGPRFSVRRILFEGNAHTRDEVVRNALVIREGDFFSRRVYEESIKT